MLVLSRSYSACIGRSLEASWRRCHSSSGFSFSVCSVSSCHSRKTGRWGDQISVWSTGCCQTISVYITNISLHFQTFILPLIVIIQWDFCLHMESDDSQCSSEIWSHRLPVCLEWTPKTYCQILEDKFLKEWYKREWCWSFKSHSQLICQ